MKGTELVLKALKDKGIRYIFGYTGGAIMPIFDEMEKQQCFSFIMSRHEQGAAFMAQGVSRASLSTKTPQVGVCMATSGPGAMNLVTGVADAGMDSVPLIAITGQVSTGVIATDAFQESDVVGVMMPISKQVYMPLDVHDIEETIHEAFYLATSGRGGPVVIDIPKDIQTHSTAETYDFSPDRYEPDLPGFHFSPYPDRENIRKAVTLINRSERPVILCGHGVVGSNAGALLRTFIEKTNIPVCFTLHGLSALPVDHPLSLGMVGMHGTIQANRVLPRADMMIALGMRFDDRVTGALSTFANQADIIHVDIDPSEIDKNVKTSVAINADTAETLARLLKDPELMPNPRRRWHEAIAEFRKEQAVELKTEMDKGTGKKGRLLMKTIVSKLSDVTGGKDIIVSDVGQHQMALARFYNFQTFNSWFTSGGAGTMGCAMPMGVGVKLVRPDENVWAICGDGGFQMNIQELGAIMEYKVPLKILLFNNGYLGMVRQWQTLFYDGRFAGTPMKNPDFGAITKAYGITYRKVETVDDIEPALHEAADHDQAILVEFLCDPSEIILPMVPAGCGLEDMIISLDSLKKEGA